MGLTHTASQSMPKEIFPSSYGCNCGHQSHFFENAIRDIKAMSHKKKVRLGDLGAFV